MSANSSSGESQEEEDDYLKIPENAKLSLKAGNLSPTYRLCELLDAWLAETVQTNTKQLQYHTCAPTLAAPPCACALSDPPLPPLSSLAAP